jgi:hypothetical protein
VTHACLSPILQAAPGSTHGYDVVDHSQSMIKVAEFDRLHGIKLAEVVVVAVQQEAARIIGENRD